MIKFVTEQMHPDMRPFALFTLLIALALVGCEQKPSPGSSTQTALQETEKLNVFLDSVFDAAVSRAPQWESRLGIRTHYGEWNDQSDEGELEEIRIRTAELAALEKRIDYEALDHQGKLSYRLFEEEVKRMQAKEKWIDHS